MDNTMERRTVPMAYFRPLYSTTLLLSTKDSGCDSSFLLLYDFRLEICHRCKMDLSHEAYLMTNVDMAFQNASCSPFPCTHALL